MGSPESPLPPLSVNNFESPQVQPEPTAKELTWTPSKAEALDTARVVLSGHIPRAWERVPQPPLSEDSRFKKVWKAHSFSSHLPGQNARRHTVQPQEVKGDFESAATPSPQRALKKLRTGASNDELETDISTTGGMGVLSSPTYVATKWESRGNYLPRKRAQSLNTVSVYPADNTPDMLSLDDSNIAMTDADVDDLEEIEEDDVGDRSANNVQDDFIGRIQPDQVKEDAIPGDDVTTEADLSNPTAQNDAQIRLDLIPQDNEISDHNEEHRIMQGTSKLEIPLVFPQEPSKSRRKPTAESSDDSSKPENVDAEAGSTLDENEESQGGLAEVHDSVDNSDLIDLSVAESFCAQSSYQALVTSQTSIEVTQENDEDIGNMSVLPEIEVDHKISGTFVESLIQISTENESSITQQDFAEQHTASSSPKPHDLVEVTSQAIEEQSKEDVPSGISTSKQVSDSSEELVDASVQVNGRGNQAQEIGAPCSPISEAIEKGEKGILSFEEDVTTTMTITSLQHLEEDKAFLQSFLDRTAASKANKPTQIPEDENCTRRESVQNRRDSDAVRIALASPGRLPLENKDTNLLSPNKLLQSVMEDSPSVHKSPSKVLPESEFVLPSVDELFTEPARPSSPRRSGRARTTRFAGTTSNASGPHFIAVRGNETMTLSLTKTESQLLANETKRNTRKNKGPALSVTDRLVKWSADLAVIGKDGTTPEPKPVEAGQKGVRWSESMEFLNEATGQPEKEPLLFNEKAPEPVDAKVPVSVIVTPAKVPRVRVQTRSATNSGRRLRGLGTANGTPAKGVLASTLLPDEVAEQKEAATTNVTNNDTPAPAAKPTKSIKTAATQAKAAKSRIPPPKKLNLTPSVKSIVTATDEPSAPKAKARRASMLPVAGGAAGRKSRKT